MTLPQVPTPAGIPQTASEYDKLNAKLHKDWLDRNSTMIPATSTDPSRLKALEKAVKTAKPMGGK